MPFIAIMKALHTLFGVDSNHENHTMGIGFDDYCDYVIDESRLKTFLFMLTGIIN